MSAYVLVVLSLALVGRKGIHDRPCWEYLDHVLT